MSSNDFDFTPRRGWVCPLYGRAHNPIMMTCPCNEREKPDHVTCAANKTPDRWEIGAIETEGKQ